MTTFQGELRPLVEILGVLECSTTHNNVDWVERRQLTAVLHRPAKREDLETDTVLPVGKLPQFNLFLEKNTR